MLYKDIIYPDDLENVQDVFEKKIRSGSPEFIIEYRILTKTGDVRWINQRTFIQKSTGGQITHFQVMVLDITKRKKSEEKLEKVLKMQKILTTVINNSPVVSFSGKTTNLRAFQHIMQILLKLGRFGLKNPSTSWIFIQRKWQI